MSKVKAQSSKGRSKLELTIVHLYANEMNIYGDRGNVITLLKRCQWRGIKTEFKTVGVGDKFDFRTADIVFAGGGQDRGQVVVGADLLEREKNLRQAVDDGVVMLTVCGTYQLFGRGFATIDGHEIPGINIFAARTVGSNHRMIGNMVVDSPWGELVGFENHSGETMLEPGQMPLGQVVKGYGNNYVSRHEGAVYKNAFGTYLHGPILPKNPRFADHLIKTALERKYGLVKLKPLHDRLEHQAAQAAARQPQ
jgi:hypothetical protein